MSPEPIEFEVEKDVTLRGQRWPGRAVTICLVHEPGEQNDLDNWRPLIPYLLSQELTIISVDLRGHGASDGVWREDSAVNDLVAMITTFRQLGTTSIIVAAVGASCIAAIRAAGRFQIDGLILISPILDDGIVPRGAGESKLIVFGAADSESQATSARLLQASIGPALSVSVPTAATGFALFESECAATCREHISSFLRGMESGEPMQPPPRGEPADIFPKLLGVQTNGDGT